MPQVRSTVGSTTALVVAAGRGTRAVGGRGGDGRSAPKQYVPIGGVPVLAHTLRAFMAHPRIDAVRCVIHADDRTLYDAAIAAALPGLPGLPGHAVLMAPVVGGVTRQASVLAGLVSLSDTAPARVLIHDAARPFVDSATIDRVIDALADTPGALAAEPVTDTLKRASPDRHVGDTVDRAGFWRAQTPQGFHFAAILAAHGQAAATLDLAFTDDASIAEWAGLAVRLVDGSAANVKLTTREDIDMADRQFAANARPDIRTGQGFDVHKFAEGDHVWLGGIRIPHTHRLDGHSDADVVLHALTDALLGTIGDGDIGQHFPPSDPQWKGAASHIFLAHAHKLVANRGGRITNVDVTVLAEAPRIGPHRIAMQARIAEILGLTVDRVGVKATTTETLGFTGRREGIAAMAIATVDLGWASAKGA